MFTIDLPFNVVMGGFDFMAVMYWRRNPTLVRSVTIGLGLVVCSLLAGYSLDTSRFGQMRLWAYAVFLHGTVLAFVAACILARVRRTLPSVAAGVLCVGLFGIAVDAFLVEPTWLEVTTLEVRTAKLKRRIRIAVIADLQTDSVGDYERAVFGRVVESDPDLVLFLGDYVQTSGPEFEHAAHAFNLLTRELISRTSAAAYAVKGDVEHFADWPLLFHGTGVTAFQDTSSVTSQNLVVTGLSRDSSANPHFVHHADSRFHIVFGHRPDFALGLVEGDLLLAGHTHGGQVRLPLVGPLTVGSSIPRKWSSGVTALGGGRTLVVSRGIGMERGRAPRMRFLCRPELLFVDVVPE